MLVLVGIALILHGLAHAGPGMWATGPLWAATFLWWVASVALIAAGLGALGVARLRPHVVPLTIAGALGSALMLYFFASLLVIPGVLVDMLFVTLVTRPSFRRRIVERHALDQQSLRARVTLAVAATFLVYVSAVIALRPWFMRMGTTEGDRSIALFGDSLYPDAKYIVNHAITVRAPADSVWPWLAQIGQDRAGFYSYSALENLFGARITNADSLVSPWQTRRVGELVRAVPPDYLGGWFGPDVGWRIVAIDPGRAIVLDKWGAFSVRPIDARRTRLQIRQRNPGTPSVMGIVVAPAGLLILEPAHFIMQRAMLRGIKQRAERRTT